MSYSASGDAPERPAAEGSSAPPPNSDLDTGAGVTSGETAPQPTMSRGEIPGTRTARAHNALIAGAIVLILLLVFILENTERVKISYFGVGFHMQLGVALLLAAIGGALLVGIFGAARILQLRRRVRNPR
jgi:uncharacterized integral membrane protein